MMRASILLLGVITLPMTAQMQAGEIRVTPNITYATVGETKLQLDLAAPAEGEGPFPALVFIHGGGWVGGNRHSYRTKIEEAAAKGYVAITISYRLTQPDPKTTKPAAPHPAQIHDCKAAVRWLRTHAADHHVDPNRIGVIGASAGGHLSLLIGLSDADDGLEETTAKSDVSTRVQAVVNIFGPTDLPVIYKSTPAVKGMLNALCDGTLDAVPEHYKQASPVTYITSDDPPILTLHGDADQLVPVEQAKILDSKLKEAGVPHEMIILAGQGHGFGGDAAVEAEKAIWDFFAKHLAKSESK